MKMKKDVLFVCLFLGLSFFKANAQEVHVMDEMEANLSDVVLNGVVYDAKNEQVLPYVNILVKRTNIGTVTNEKGSFSLAGTNLKPTDTVSFQFIGFKHKELTVSEVLVAASIFLEEDVFSISEVFVLSKQPDPKDVVKQVLIRQEKNYKIEPRKEQTFVRRRELTDLLEFEIDYKKSTIEELSIEKLSEIEEKVPKHSTSYTDFLGTVFVNKNEEGKKIMKIDPIKKVKLKSKELTELKQYESLFEDLFTNTEDKEYWKIKSGIFSDKLEIEEKDSIEKKKKHPENTDNLKRFRNAVKNLTKYATFQDKDLWEFLHKTNAYIYSFEGGTTINNEDVYIIDFVLKRKGLYEGRLYIAIKTNAMIRADYRYAPNKMGKDLHLLGFSHEQSHFSGSIFFEKRGKNYVLKYFSHKNIEAFGVERNMALLKKKKRFLFNKTLEELKIAMDIKIQSQEIIEYLVLDGEMITNEAYHSFTQKERMNVIYVDQFDENLWKGYSIIEPTQQMKDYKKLE